MHPSSDVRFPDILSLPTSGIFGAFFRETLSFLIRQGTARPLLTLFCPHFLVYAKRIGLSFQLPYLAEPIQLDLFVIPLTATALI